MAAVWQAEVFRKVAADARVLLIDALLEGLLHNPAVVSVWGN